MLIAPPGNIKTSLINTLATYSDALCLGDINVKSLSAIRGDIVGNRYRTLAFGEMEKLYARNPATASNIEGNIQMFVEEGLRHMSFEDPRATVMPARCMVVTGITNGCFARHITNWMESGFLRRFMRINYVLANEQTIIESIHAWKKLDFGILPLVWNGRASLPYNLAEKESKMLARWLKDQQTPSTPYVLLKKIAVVLKSKFPKEYMDILEDFSDCLSKDGAVLEL